MDLLKGLNPAQNEAVQITSGPLLILAGAGSGKTKVLTHRIAYLIAKQKFLPRQILAVTFTNKAAKEMRIRLGKLLGENGENRLFMPWMGTFHGICVRLLRADGDIIGIPKRFVIYDDNDRLGLIKQSMKLLSLVEADVKAKAVNVTISNAKNDMISPEEYGSTAQSPFEKSVARIYKRYEALRKTAGALDFDDLLIEVVRLLRDNPDVRAKWQDSFKHILVDEYQDTNAAQYNIIKLLVNKDNNICVVGDDWQCLVEGSLVETKIGLKKIENIKKGEMVRSASGYGTTNFFKVTDCKRSNYSGEVTKITTSSGKIITSTPDHIMFAKWGDMADMHFVYLMFSRLKGYRIGLTKGMRFNGKKQDIGLHIRANQERADRMWVLKVCSNRQDAIYHEALISYKYGIPMMVFNEVNNTKIHLEQKYIDNLYKEIDTADRAKKLMSEFDILFDYPHFQPQATSRNGMKRVNLNVVLFGDKRVTATSPWSASRLSINTTSSDDLIAFKKLGHSVRSGKAGTFRSEIHNLDYGNIELSLNAVMKSVEKDSMNIHKYGFLTDEAFLFLPASQIHPGMLLPVSHDNNTLTADKVVSITREKYNGKVFDLDIDKVHNYLSDGVAVHNCIYSWRGADFTNILNFERDFKNAKVIKLEQNYRSTANILNAASHVISNNKNRTKKELWTAISDGEPVRVEEVYDETEEAYLVAQRISSCVNLKARQYGDFAVLYRTNAQSYTLERAFLNQHIPYKIVGGVRFYDRKEIKDIIAYLRLIYQPQDRMSFCRIVNVPVRGVGAISLEKFMEWQAGSGMDIITALSNVEQTSIVTTRAKVALITLGKKLNILQSMVEDSSPKEIIEKLLKLTKYREYLDDKTSQAEERDDNVGSLLSDSQNFADLAGFLEEVALMSSADADSDSQKVTLMTLHASKGLEFPVVFIVGLEEGILPHVKIFEENPDGLEEERRLCYVGMTRAKQELYMSYAQSRMQFGQKAYNTVSRFIAEMGDNVELADSLPEKTVAEQEFFSDTPFEVGDIVRSAAFGNGEVTEVDGLALTIKFDDGRTKKLNAEFARLEKI